LETRSTLRPAPAQSEPDQHISFEATGTFDSLNSKLIMLLCPHAFQIYINPINFGGTIAEIQTQF